MSMKERQTYDGVTGQPGGGEKAGGREAGNPGMNREWKREKEVKEKRSFRLICTMH